MATIIGQKAFQGIASGIGLVSEGISAHKAKKQNKEAYPQGQSPQETSSLHHGDAPPPYELQAGELPHTEETAAESLEEHWALDEAQEELLHQSAHHDQFPEVQDPQEKADTGKLADRFLSRYPAPLPHTPIPRISAPVVLPQRRPKNRERGFVRAYAPALADCGIDQTMFIDFLNTAEKSCQAKPWLNAINLASLATIALPSVTGLAVSIAIQITTDIIIAADGRRSTNNFFSKMNHEFFQPRGLFCLVLTWNPELLDAPATTVDLNSLISKAASDGGSGMIGRLMQKFKSSDGKGYGNIFPEVAPLVFPEIDQLASDQDGQKKLSGLKKKQEFVGGYLDKRAQAKFAAENPDSYLNQGPTPTFTSRYADPNHPASSGDPLALVTGGHASMGAIRGGTGIGGRRRLGAVGLIGNIMEMRNASNVTGSTSRPVHGNGPGRGPGAPRPLENLGALAPITKLLKKKVLYLAVVSMPPEDEMNRAREALGQI